jgi:glycosyltransferase involved in cell wall biosynthesis
VIYNGFDFSGRLAAPDPALRAELGIATPYAVGMVARFGAHKDYPCYFAAAEQILARRDDITFLAIGDGPGLEAWQARFAQQPRVRVLGRRGDVERICAVLDAGVLATAVGAHGEGISNALTEFLAVGKPVVATDDGGNRELVGEHGCGLLVPPADPGALAAAIERLIDRPDEARAMGGKGACVVREVFSREAMVDAWLALYRQILR